jgi:hypothetical protein
MYLPKTLFRLCEIVSKRTDRIACKKVGRALAFFIKRTFDVVEFFNLLELLVLWFEIVPYQMRCMTLRMRF